MKSLAGRIETAMEVLGFPKEDRPFSGHVTLGRVRSPRATEKLRDCIERLRDEQAGSAQVDGVSVMKSELFRSGPEYSSIADLGFQIAE
jgi:2'-5' RNA ligase